MSIIFQQNCHADCQELSVITQTNIKDWISGVNTQFHIIVRDNCTDAMGLQDNFIDLIYGMITAENGQYIHIDANDLVDSTLSRRLYSIMVEVLANRPYRIELPIILQHNPHAASPFIDRAIVWQRLCDMILEDDTPKRPTVLVLENLEIANQNIQHELARLIRLHKKNRINRNFIATINQNNIKNILPELNELATFVETRGLQE
ncbi:MAG: hypothetical protein LBP59_07945 [Planctomycetaceae bacterium]|jgi:hypothetical protein|nr:hypothetical protein [Planctomycetaceae bacterium]